MLSLISSYATPLSAQITYRQTPHSTQQADTSATLYFNSSNSTRIVLLNLFGNLLALIPMAFFLPILFKKQNKFKNFIITIILIVLGIELTQLLTTSYSCDVDDIILNINSIKKTIVNIFLLEKNKILKKDIIEVITIIFICIILVFSVVIYRNELYNQNLEKYMNFHNPVIDKSEVCAEALDEFYEDKLFRYYFTFMKSNDVYTITNNNKMT